MSKSVRLLAMFGVLAALSACGGGTASDEYVVVDPEPISAEPTYTGKYK